MCLAQGHKAMTLVRLEPATLGSLVKHSTTEFPRTPSGSAIDIDVMVTNCIGTNQFYQKVCWFDTQVF